MKTRRHVVFGIQGLAMASMFMLVACQSQEEGAGAAPDVSGGVPFAEFTDAEQAAAKRNDKIAPTVTAFALPSPAGSRTVAISAFTASDNVAVTGYRITESATAPLASSTGWWAAPPASFTFSTTGTRTAYAWAKDAAGNVSLSRSASVTIATVSPTPTPTSTVSPTPTATPPSPSEREAMLKSRFDIVETFDNLADWYASQGGGNYYGAQYGPRRLDGSYSQWTYYSSWNTGSSNTPWIANFGAGTSVTGKSLIIDMGGAAGPSRLGMYFGNGAASSGYSDIYVFHRVKYPQNEWPTAIDANKVGSYTEGQPWVWWSSWKANTINMGCTGVNANTQCSGAEPYANYHIVPHVKSYSGTSPRSLLYVLEPTGVSSGATKPIWTSGYQVQRNTWSGVEYHYRNYVEAGRLKTSMDMWIYDANGTAHQVLNGAIFDYTGLQAETDKWNFFFLGGNNSASYTWGPTMTSKYYIDDFIIDGTRIGPAYFSLIAGN